MFQITILLTYLIAAYAFALSRLRPQGGRVQLIVLSAFLLTGLGFALHAHLLWGEIFVPGGISVTLTATVSFIGLQLSLIALLGAMEPTLRGMSAALLVPAALLADLTGWQSPAPPATAMSWQLEGHILVSLFAYGLLTVGAIVAIFSLILDRRLRSGKVTPMNQLFAPLETTERLLFGITSAGFAILLIAVVSGLAFIENIFAQHLVHKTVLSLVALALFGTLLAGRRFAGWRGRRAVYLYLGGFVMLGLAYFGSRFILEFVLDRSWG